MSTVAICLLVLLPPLVHSPLIGGALRSDPRLLVSGLQAGLRAGPLIGEPTLDPNIGFTSQALGHRAALDIASGHVPWWNHYEGVGVPLAGEMQSAALFPLTLLQFWPDGQLYEHILLQVIAGLSTYALLRRLDVHPVPAFGGSAAFALNGAFAWLGNAVVNPVPFLPMLIAGLEGIAAGSRRSGLWNLVITGALALSLYAGFPETAYLDGLLALAWAVVRTVTLGRPAGRRFMLNVAIAGVSALLIAAPILVAFADYLAVAEIPGHDLTSLLHQHLDARYLPTVLLPYELGLPGQQASAQVFWGGVGGYGGCALLTIAAAGLFGAKRRALRVLLGGWIVVSLGLTFGLPGLGWIYAVVPGLGRVAVYRYADASWILCACVLGAFAVDDLLARGVSWPLRGSAAMVAGVLGCWLALQALGSHHARDASGIAAVIALAIALVIAAAAFLPRMMAAGVMVTVLVAEASAWFMVPLLCYPRDGHVESGGIAFLEANLGLQRFATLGPIAPNYGSYYGLAAVNYNDLPIASSWVNYVRHHLDSDIPSVIFNGDMRQRGNAGSAREQLLAHQDAFANVGVRFVVAPLAEDLPGLPEVFRDQVSHIYALDHAKAYVEAPGCQVDVRGRDDLVVRCETASRLVRRELMMPGWRAWENGRRIEVETAEDIFQRIDLPVGVSRVTFDFRPIYMRWAVIAFVVGLTLSVLQTGLGLRHSRSA